MSIATARKGGGTATPLPPEAPLTYSILEAARLLGLGRTAAYNAVQTGDLPTVRFGGLLRVPKAALERLLTNPPAYQKRERLPRRVDPPDAAAPGSRS